MPAILIKNLTEPEIKALRRVKNEMGAETWKDFALKAGSSTGLKDVVTNPDAEIDREFEMIKIVGRALRNYYGLNPDPIQFQIGIKMGRAAADRLPTPPGGVEGILKELVKIWTKYQLGQMNIQQIAPPTITVTECFDCPGAPDLSRTLCSFKEGVISAILGAKLGPNTILKEIECCGTGAPSCKYVIAL